jgi:hypothetical protein
MNIPMFLEDSRMIERMELRARKIVHTCIATILIVSIAFAFCYAQSVESTRPATRYLLIESVPSAATVTVDSEFTGRTPFVLPVARGRSLLVMVQKNGYIPFRCRIVPQVNDTTSITAVLERLSGSVSVMTAHDKTTITIDGRAFERGSIDSLPLDIGTHEIVVFDSTYQRAISSSIEVEQLKHVSLKVEYDVISTRRLFWSLLLPGYAQLSDRNFVEGFGFVFAGIGSGASVISEILQYGTAKQNYQTALTNYDNASTEVAAEHARLTADRMQDEYRIAQKNLRVAVGVAVLIWVGNALDVAFNHILTDRIEVLGQVETANPQLRGSPNIRLALQIPVR